MLKNISSRKGQNMAEYAIIFGVVIAAAVGVSALIKQGIGDRVVHEITKLGDDRSAGSATFDIGSNSTRNGTRDENITVDKGGQVTEKLTSFQKVKADENYTVGSARP